MAQRKKIVQKRKVARKDPISGRFIMLILLAIAAFIIGLLPQYSVSQRYSFIFLSIILLLLAVLSQLIYSRRR